MRLLAFELFAERQKKIEHWNKKAYSYVIMVSPVLFPKARVL